MISATFPHRFPAPGQAQLLGQLDFQYGVFQGLTSAQIVVPESLTKQNHKILLRRISLTEELFIDRKTLTEIMVIE